MAQFVTHIQPTLIEASHHHPPHHYKEVHHLKDSHHSKDFFHHKEHHAKDAHHSKDTHHSKDAHHSKEGHHSKEAHHLKEQHAKHYEETGRGNKEHSELEGHYKDVQLHQGHPRDFPVLAHHNQSLQYKDFAESHYHGHYEEGKSDGHKRNSGHYIDSHGVPHEFQLHFIDSQGIHRDYHGHPIDTDHYHKEQKPHEEKSHKEKPIPPKYIDIQPIQFENKKVSQC